MVNGDDTVVDSALAWINNMVYGHNLIIEKKTVSIGIDTLKISALIENPNSHQVYGTVSINNLLGTFWDSLNLAEVGMDLHSELWQGSYISQLNSEDFFNIALRTSDLSTGKSKTITNVDRFTTAGPLAVDSVLSVHFPALKRFSIKPYIINFGNFLPSK